MKRLVLISRGFWPLVGEPEVVVANLAAEFRRLGASPVVVTAQWEKRWPAEFVHREVPVTRLPHPTQRGWGTLRYLIALSRWLRRNRSETDLVCVSGLRDDAYAAVGALNGSRVPIVLRCEYGAELGDCAWQQRATLGNRVKRRCLQADAFVAPNEAIGAELRAAGYPHERIHVIANGVPIAAVRDASSRSVARSALAAAHPVLRVKDRDPLVVFAGPLHASMGVDDLLRAWPSLVARWRQARLWLVGEGTSAEKIWKRIKRLGLREHVIMTGSFDDLEEVLHAADLFVLPSHTEGTSLALLQAMSIGLPILASDLPGHRELALQSGDAYPPLFPAQDIPALIAAITRVLSDPQTATARALANCDAARQRYCVTRMADEHLALFERLIAAKQPS
jgi:glycosyltransferase involved in cell wall biosynthesis